jgi:hypothetical protein
MLTFKRSGQDSNEKIVTIKEQQMDSKQNTYHDEVYDVKIGEMNLRELMVIYSIFMCEGALEIVKLIKLQPNPRLFQRSFMELDQSNMIQILSFESRIITCLLEDFDDSMFDTKTPMFYKMRHNIDGRSVVRSALDLALENNQIKAVNAIIKYIV